MDNRKRCPKWAQRLALYLDDLLLLAGGCCFVWAAWKGLGAPVGVAVAGVWLCVLAIVVARAKKGG